MKVLSSLHTDIRQILEHARNRTRSAINSAMVEAYWLIGKRIVEEEQQGENRAQYGKRTLETLTAELSQEFGTGFSYANLRNFRQFYLTYPDDILIANAYDEDLLHVRAPNLTGLRLSLHSGAFSAGGIFSTSSDVAYFTRALFAGGIVSEESLAEMTTFVDAPDTDAPERIGYGLGVRQMVIDGEGFVGHTGAIPGYSGVTAFGVDNGITITILSNLSVIEQERLLAEILESINP